MAGEQSGDSSVRLAAVGWCGGSAGEEFILLVLTQKCRLTGRFSSDILHVLCLNTITQGGYCKEMIIFCLQSTLN